MAKEQLAVIEMITNMILGKTDGVSKVDFTPQKIPFPESLPYEQAFLRATPESQGVSSEKLIHLLSNLSASPYTDMHHFLVLRHGNVICDCSFAPYRSGIWHISHSMCKSITGMAIGLLIDEGKLSLDENIYNIFPGKVNPLFKIFRPEITVRHLLTMTSGVTFNESGIVSGNDWMESYLNAPVTGKPGTEFQYNSLNTYVLSAIVSAKTEMTLEEYLRSRLFEPLGITRYLWETCPKGITKGGWGLFICPEDMAKLGQLYLNHGMWHEKQIIPADWIRESTTKQVDSIEGTYGYGYQIWMENRLNSFEFNGMLGQNVIVYPDLDMVIVTCAGNNELFQNNVMLDLIRDAFPQEYQASEYALPENPAEYHKLTHLVHSLSHGSSCMPQIRRGGWTKKSGYSRSHAIYPKYVRLLKDLDGKCYNINPASVGLFPLIIQVFHNNLTNGIRQISFQYDKINCPDKFYIHFLEGEEHCTLTVSFDCYIDNLITLHEETYLVAVKCEYTTDADHAPVLVLDMVYLEEAMSRKLYLHFKSNELMAHWSESPGKELILEGLSSITGEMTKLPLYGHFLEGSGMQFLEHIMADTIEPTVHGTLAESDTEDVDI